MEGVFYRVAQETFEALGVAKAIAGENLLQLLPYLGLGEDILAPLRDGWPGWTLGGRWFHRVLRTELLRRHHGRSDPEGVRWRQFTVTLPQHACFPGRPRRKCGAKADSRRPSCRGRTPCGNSYASV